MNERAFLHTVKPVRPIMTNEESGVSAVKRRKSLIQEEQEQ